MNLRSWLESQIDHGLRYLAAIILLKEAMLIGPLAVHPKQLLRLREHPIFDL